MESLEIEIDGEIYEVQKNTLPGQYSVYVNEDITLADTFDDLVNFLRWKEYKVVLKQPLDHGDVVLYSVFSGNVLLGSHPNGALAGRQVQALGLKGGKNNWTVEIRSVPPSEFLGIKLQGNLPKSYLRQS